MDSSGILMKCACVPMGTFCFAGPTCLVPALEIDGVRVSRLHALATYRGTSLIRNCVLIGPLSRTMPRALRWSQGGMLFLMSEVPLCTPRFAALSPRLVTQDEHNVRVGMYSLTIKAPIPVSRPLHCNPPYKAPLPVSRVPPRARTHRGQPGPISLSPRPAHLRRLSLSLCLCLCLCLSVSLSRSPPPRNKVF